MRPNAFGYCCYYARARYGRLMLEHRRANGREVLPASWLTTATAANPADRHYRIGYVSDGEYGFFNGGAFGQIVYVFTKYRVVIVKTTLYSDLGEAETLTVMRAVAAKVAATR
ncbi:hypothetical protein [Actinomadura macrotermitis]|uniref:Beta-lactamase-related domain-containing protein n=1 Tax=Actinomadura macrotermitis TaxID=2585200 RepID=A0A7K0C0L6_9ACTN|nr:hypothetical protein [Actinomadura macrotermitis]MQY06987.1 hypothetical protein [Actinomadura macrotermitis]